MLTQIRCHRMLCLIRVSTVCKYFSHFSVGIFKSLCLTYLKLKFDSSNILFSGVWVGGSGQIDGIFLLKEAAICLLRTDGMKCQTYFLGKTRNCFKISSEIFNQQGKRKRPREGEGLGMREEGCCKTCLEMFFKCYY